jgi:hypothetical protein
MISVAASTLEDRWPVTRFASEKSHSIAVAGDEATTVRRQKASAAKLRA